MHSLNLAFFMLINHEVVMFGEVVIGVSALPCVVPRNPDTIDISEQDIQYILRH